MDYKTPHYYSDVGYEKLTNAFSNVKGEKAIVYKVSEISFQEIVKKAKELRAQLIVEVKQHPTRKDLGGKYYIKCLASNISLAETISQLEYNVLINHPIKKKRKAWVIKYENIEQEQAHECIQKQAQKIVKKLSKIKIIDDKNY